jgi:HEAT repeat-containing protein 5
MQADDPAVVAAMDGQDTVDRTSSGHTGAPAALFFVLYGLAFDALASSSVENATNTADSRRNVAIALLALRSLVKPQYSGDILTGGPIFEELISLLHRMALTEPADSLIGLVDVVKDLSYIRTPNTGLRYETRAFETAAES